MFSLLRQPNLRRFFLAQAQSQLGTGASYVALVLIAYQRLHSSWAVALVLLSDFLPGVVLAPAFGVLADRHSRRRLAVAAELVRAGAFFALAVVGSFEATVALALTAGLGTALFRPAVNAALPGLVTPAERAPATALYGGLQDLGVMLGPALCGLAVMLGPATWVLLANAVTFLVSAGLLAGVPLERAVPGAGERPAAWRDVSDTGERPTAWQEARAGLRYAVRERRVGVLLLLAATAVLCGALINVAEPLLAIGPLHAGSSGFSILVTLYGVGMVAGAAYTARLRAGVAALRGHFLAGLAVSGVTMLACAAAASLLWALVPFFLAGFANALIINPEIRLVQELVRGDFRGRVCGLRDSLECGCFAVAFVAAGALVNAIGPRALYAVSGVLLLGTAMLGLAVFGTSEPAGTRLVEAPATS